MRYFKRINILIYFNNQSNYHIIFRKNSTNSIDNYYSLIYYIYINTFIIKFNVYKIFKNLILFNLIDFLIL